MATSSSGSFRNTVRGLLGLDKSVLTQFRYMIKIGEWFKASPLEWDDELQEVRVFKPRFGFDLKKLMLSIQIPLLIAEAVFIIVRIPAQFEFEKHPGSPLDVIGLTIHFIWICEFLQTINLLGYQYFHVDEFCSLANKTIRIMMRLEAEGGMKRGFLMQIYLIQNTIAPIFMPSVLAAVYLEFYRRAFFITGTIGTKLDSWTGYATLFANATLEYWLDLQYWACLCSWCQILLIGLHTVKLTTSMALDCEPSHGSQVLYREMQAYMAALGSYYSKLTLPLTLTLLTIGMTFLVCGTIRFPGVISISSYLIFPIAVVNLALVSYNLHDTAGGAIIAGHRLMDKLRGSQSRIVRKYARSLSLRLSVANYYWIDTNTVIIFFEFIIDRTVDIFLITGL